MSRISISAAWNLGVAFFTGRHRDHAIILIGVGIILPTILQALLACGAGGMKAMSDPDMMANPAAAMGLAGGGFFIALLAAWLQFASYWGSWRLGVADDELGPALTYGLKAGGVMLVVISLLVLVIGVIFFVVLGAVFGGGLLAALAGGDQLGMASMTGLGFGFLLVLPLLLLLSLWLSARLSCVGPIMAEGGNLDVVGAIKTSWAMAAASQWRIIGYLVLLFIALVVILGILGGLAGVAMIFGGGSLAIVGVVIGALLIGIPSAYLTVAVPAGIYRALGGASPAEIFA